jgi:uncharacterized membrane protein
LLPNVRQKLIDRFGANVYKAMFAICALGGLVVAIIGKGNAPFVPIWNPAPWSPGLAALLMVAAFVAWAAMALPTNIKRYTRHPMLWGIVLWSAAHLLANGDAASVVFFGAFGLFALYAMWSLNRRGAVKSAIRYPLTKDLIVVVLGVLVYALFLFAHPYLFGVPAWT